MRTRSILLLGVFPLFSCGGEPEPVAPAPIASATARRPVVPSYDISELPAPDGMIAFAEARSPKGSADEVLSWFGLPSMSLTKLGKELTHEDVGEAIDPAKPVFAALTFSGRPGGTPDVDAAISVGLRPSSEAKAEIEKRFRFIEKGNGVIFLESKRLADKEKKSAARGGDEGDEGDEEDSFKPKERCALFPAYERESLGGIRLVCADSEAALMKIGPYLTRSATRSAPKHDVRIEVKVAPLKDTIEQGRAMLPMLSSLLSMGGMGGMSSTRMTSKGGPALPPGRWLTSITSLADDAITGVEDIDSIELRADTGKDGGQIEADVRLKSVDATLTKIFLSRADISSSAPASFFRLPSDASSAYYSFGLDDKAFSPAKAEMRAALVDLFQNKKLPAADGTAAADLLDGWLHVMTAPHVSSSGTDLSAYKALLAKAPKGGKESDLARASFTSMASWQIARYEEPFAAVASLTQRTVGLLKKPSVGKTLASILEKLGRLDAPKIGAAPKEFPKGSLRTEGGFTMEADKGKPSKTRTITFVVPDGDATWLASGGDEALVKKKLLDAMAGTSTLGGREGLEELHNTRAASGGFFTLRSLLAVGPVSAMLVGKPERLADLDGATPIPMQFQKELTATGGRMSFRIRFPKGAAPEILRAAMASHLF